MRKLLALCLVLALLIPMSVSVFAATPEEIKYDFDSADELNDWQAFGGSWKIEEGCLKQTSGTPGSWNMHLALKDVVLKDFTVRMRMRVTKESLGTGWAALYFRKLNLGDNQEMSGYGLTMEGKSSKGKTVVVDWAHSSKTFEDQCKSNPGDWNDIVLAVSGNTLKIYFNEDIATKTPTMTIVDKDNGWMDAGYMSLAAGNAKIDVDYFYLYSGKSQDKAFAGASVETPTEPAETEPAVTQPKETQPKETQPKETQPKETQPKETQPKETKPPKEETPKETQPKETKPPKDETPKETQPKETKPPKEETPKETQPKETEPAETKPADSYKEVNETVYTTQGVNVRSAATSSSEKLGFMEAGTAVTRTGIGDNGWSRIEYNGKVAYVFSQYLTTTNPNPDATEPAGTEPAETKPVETKPVETEPVETEPVETEPVETEPAATEPAETEPVETEPAETQPTTTAPTENPEPNDNKGGPKNVWISIVLGVVGVGGIGTVVTIYLIGKKRNAK